MGKKKHGYNILAGLFGGFGDAASEYSRLKEKKGDSEEKLLQALSMLSLKHQLDQSDPYKQALTQEALARAQKLGQPPEPDVFDKKLAIFNKLNAPTPITPAEMASAKANEAKVGAVKGKLSDILPGFDWQKAPTPPGVTTVKDLMENQKKEEERYGKNLSSFIGGKGFRADEESLKLAVKELSKLDPLIDRDKYALLLKRIVDIMGPDAALDAGFIDQDDLDSGAYLP